LAHLLSRDPESARNLAVAAHPVHQRRFILSRLHDRVREAPGLISDLDPSIFVGAKRLLRPLMRWTAARARKRGREAELLRRYASDERRGE
jgi:hypothetical protein